MRGKQEGLISRKGPYRLVVRGTVRGGELWFQFGQTKGRRSEEVIARELYPGCFAI